MILTWKIADDGKYMKITLLNKPEIEIRVYSPSYLQAWDLANKVGRILQPDED